MATLVFMAVGSAMGGPPGAMAGSMIGSYIDSNFIFPEIFGKEEAFGGSLSEIAYQTYDEGAARNISYGNRCKTSGTVIWMDEIRNEPNVMTTGRSGKGGGSRPEIPPQAHFKTHLAVSISSDRPIADPVLGHGILQIKCDQKIIYVKGRTFDETSTLFSVIQQGILLPYFASKFPDGPDLRLMEKGREFTSSGFSKAANNVTATVKGTGFHNVEGQDYTIMVPKPANLEAEAAGANANIEQILPDLNPGLVDGFRVYPGAHDQSRDPLIQSIEGNDCPAFRNTAFFILENFRLKNFSNRVPQFEIRYSADLGGSTLGTAIEDICSRSGMPSNRIDTTGCIDQDGNDIIISGYVITGAISCAKSLQPLLLAYDILVQEKNGKLYFFSKITAQSVMVKYQDLACIESGDAPVDPLDISKVDEVDLPRSVVVKYFNLANNLQRGSEPAYNHNAPGNREDTLNLNLVLENENDAIDIAERMLWNAWQSKSILRVSLPYTYLHAIENDILVFPAYGEIWRLLVKRRDRGANGLLLYEGPSTQYPEVDYTYPIPGDGLDNEDPPPHLPPWIQFNIVEIPISHPGGSGKGGSRIGFPPVGVYWAACNPQTGDPWVGAALYKSTDGGTSWDSIAVSPSQATMGESLTALGGGVHSYTTDRVNSIRIRLHQKVELASCTLQELYAGANRFVIGNETDGWEIIGAKTITLETPVYDDWPEYTLSYLLRGLDDSDSRIDGHAIGDVVIAMNEAGIEFLPLSLAEIGSDIKFRCCPVDDDPSLDVHGYEEREIQLSVESSKPFTPHKSKWTHDGDDTDTFTWERQIRIPDIEFPERYNPLPEMAESYEIDIHSYADDNITLRTLECGSEKTVTYIKAMKIEDGQALGTQYNIRIYQIDPIFGRGRPKVVEAY